MLFRSARIIEAVDAERLALAAALGIQTLSLVDALASAGYTSPEAARSGSVHTALQAGEPISRVKAPPTLDHRYLHEDVGWGLVQWINLAKLANVPTPTMQGLTTLAGVLNSVNYYIDGLTLERMGMAEMAGKDVVAYAHDGPQ